jgi:hypothetical protein
MEQHAERIAAHAWEHRDYREAMLRGEIASLRAELDALKAAANPPAKRKVVQLIVLPQAGQNWNELYALADDGTIWQRYEPNGWSQSLDIPQPEQEAKP